MQPQNQRYWQVPNPINLDLLIMATSQAFLKGELKRSPIRKKKKKQNQQKLLS